MSLPRADISRNLIVLTSPHERSTDPIPIIFGVALQATKPRALVDDNYYL